MTKHELCSATTRTSPLERILTEKLHLSGHTFRFCWTVQDLGAFLVYLVKFAFGSEIRIKNKLNFSQLMLSFQQQAVKHFISTASLRVIIAAPDAYEANLLTH